MSSALDLKTDRAALLAAMREVIEAQDGDGLILTEADASDLLAERIMQALEDFEPVEKIAKADADESDTALILCEGFESEGDPVACLIVPGSVADEAMLLEVRDLAEYFNQSVLDLKVDRGYSLDVDGWTDDDFDAALVELREMLDRPEGFEYHPIPTYMCSDPDRYTLTDAPYSHDYKDDPDAPVPIGLNAPESADWYFTYNGVGGAEEFGPYDTEADAQAGINRIKAEAEKRAGYPTPDADFEGPYQESRED